MAKVSTEEDFFSRWIVNRRYNSNGPTLVLFLEIWTSIHQYRTHNSNGQTLVPFQGIWLTNPYKQHECLAIWIIPSVSYKYTADLFLSVVSLRVLRMVALMCAQYSFSSSSKFTGLGKQPCASMNYVNIIGMVSFSRRCPGWYPRVLPLQ